MITDIACADRAQHRINQRMDRHVSVAVPGQPARCIQLDPAQPQLFTVSQPVDVIARADPDWRQVGGKIGRVSQFVQRLVSLNHNNVQSGRMGDLGIVTGI